MDNKEFRESWAGVFADEGFWIDGDGDEVEISEMGPKRKKAIIRHLFKSMRYLDSCSTSMRTGLTTFSGKFAKEVSAKLEELGCKVYKEGNEFSVDEGQYK